MCSYLWAASLGLLLSSVLLQHPVVRVCGLSMRRGSMLYQMVLLVPVAVPLHVPSEYSGANSETRVWERYVPPRCTPARLPPISGLLVAPPLLFFPLLACSGPVGCFGYSVSGPHAGRPVLAPRPPPT